MKFMLLILFFAVSLHAFVPERTAKYVMDYHLVSIRDYARYEDYTSLKTLFVEYPKEFDTDYKWPAVMKILKDYEFKTLDAEYSSFDSVGKPTGISGTVQFLIGNKNETSEIHLKKNSLDSVTEWKMENQMLHGIQRKTPVAWYFS
ncbi:unnamed protein product [Caenorhabditis brenneri]